MEKRVWELSVVSPQISFQADREAVVEGKCRIIDYDEDRVLLRADRYCLQFWGRDLTVTSLSQEYLVIRGKLLRFEFLE
ncbi:MAG: YabP/YqfC family sporulation protein [Massiliimalia sp.]